MDPLRRRSPHPRREEPRTPPDARVPEVAAALAAAEQDRGPARTAQDIATRYQVSTRTAERLLTKARTHTG
ncbi:hypothetical protein [Streptomyces sp. NPDC059708]|uniref:hypothetical protein n=1 Tax=Streptomyces sp. NPDC059708 TaxID=3346916 RepID=UPI0036C04A53